MTTGSADDRYNPQARNVPAAPEFSWAALRRRGRVGLIAAIRGVLLAAFIPVEALLLAVAIVALVAPVGGVAYATGSHHANTLIALVGSLAGAVFVLPLLEAAVLLSMRVLAVRTRILTTRWCGVAIPDPYRPRPERGSWLRWVLTDRASWRDLLWAAVNLFAGPVLLVGPVLLTGFGIFAALRMVNGLSGLPASFPGPGQLVSSVVLTGSGLLLAPILLRGYGHVAQALLAPGGNAELTRRISHLSQTRTETIDSGAAEIRRIERDLHDGAQARLVAMGMTLDAAGQLIDDDPKAARALLLEARDNSAKALQELRSLVRGIHPPVLADRGLADAIRALALDTPVSTQLRSDLVGRPLAPVESAAYFAVSELLANAAKHAAARQVWIDIRHEQGMLKIGVTDDGHGGADPAAGTGLRGIERRLAAFDGVVAISSPPGGPTAVTMEIPCALSSAKTSSC
jgi:signal transduction histidine kinase